MNKSTAFSLPVFHNSLFRIPTPVERSLGLWVDRVGEAEESGPQTRLRELGLYGMVQVDRPGTFLNTVTGEERLEPGAVMLLFPKIPTLYYPDDIWRARWILWDGEEASRLRSIGYLSPERPVLQSSPVFEAVYPELRRTIHREGLDTLLERKGAVLELVREAYSARQDRQGDRMAAVVEYVRTSLQGGETVGDVAKRFSLSPTHFRRSFKAYTGQSPKEYMLAARMNRAKSMLLAGESVKAVAAQLGFSDEFHFRRTFKRLVGVTPGQWG
ncbi:MAG: AraC family transcriptional regulator [Planctomycetota bacterium]|jgi:AraC-like DNA-binding protein